MLFTKAGEQALSEELFKNPTEEYRGTPFWAWNGKMDPEELKRQIAIMKKMGMGGFHMHVRTGMDAPYLDPGFFDLVRVCLKKAEQEDMLAWLYDEDRWPSGSCGGRVTKDHPEYAMKCLLFTSRPYGPQEGREVEESVPGAGRCEFRSGNGVLLAVYDIELEEDGSLHTYHRLTEGQSPKGMAWYAYMEHAGKDPWFNDSAYVDTLQPEAMRCFLKLSHEAYYRELKEQFGKRIPAIFTDEPQMIWKCPERLSFARGENDVMLPWTAELPDTFRDAYGEDLLERLPELFWELPGGRISKIRYLFYNHLADRFRDAYSGQLGNWCRNHSLALTGHLTGEETLAGQSRWIGDCMRNYRCFGIPGIDILCDRREFTAAKQTQSIVHQTGGNSMLSELYGVTGWDCDFRTYKLQGDWQAALGVTVRVPHLFWMTMKGEAKRDYPASIGYQSPWYEKYHLIEDHFSRLNTALTRGSAIVRIAVLHPIESFWLKLGPEDMTGSGRYRMDQRFQDLAELLITRKLDFDYLCEEELPELCPEGANPLRVGEMCYDTVLVWGAETLRASTLKRLLAFRRQGGKLIFVGEAPGYVDAVPSAEPDRLYRESLQVPDSDDEILKALEPERLVDAWLPDGSRDTKIIYQLRQDGEDRWLFLANSRKPGDDDFDPCPQIRFILDGSWDLTEYDTLTGETVPLESLQTENTTRFERVWHSHDSLLLRLSPARKEMIGSGTVFVVPKAEEGRKNLDYERIYRGEPEEGSRINRTVPVFLEEPNMLLLDMAEYALNEEPYAPAEELLRLDTLLRKRSGIPMRRKEVTQPYLIPEQNYSDRLRLRFEIKTETDLKEPMVALEDLDAAELLLDGQEIPVECCGYFVDRSIQKVKLPDLNAGVHRLEVFLPFGERTNVENIYFLGDFGVRVQGTEKVLTAPVRRLGFGDIVPQGLPFYTGNLIYRMEIEVPEDSPQVTVRVPAYRGALLEVLLDGNSRGEIIYSPYLLKLGKVTPGRHLLELRFYNTRYNGFGQLHHPQGTWYYQSPNSYRSMGDAWTYEYRFREAGILTSPIITGASVV